jgi:hypothetical protein
LFCIRCSHAVLKIGVRDSTLHCNQGDKAVAWGGSCPSYSPFDKFSTSRVAASRTARSDEGARTDRLPATAAPQQTAEKSTGFDLGFSDLRRCSTADQSGVPDFEDISHGH